MLTLQQVTIYKYKSIETEQRFDVEDDITVLVGKNESGKTAILEAVHKSNSYLSERFDANYDYPRKEKKQYDRTGTDKTAIRCTYGITDQLIANISKDIGKGTLGCHDVVYMTSYQNTTGKFEALAVVMTKFFEYKFEAHDIRDAHFKKNVRNARTVRDIQALGGRSKTGKIERFLNDVKGYFRDGDSITVALSNYIISKWIAPHLPKLLYYDEYYALPSEVAIAEIQSANSSDKTLETAKALFELANINIEQLLRDNDYEGYKAELEATAVDITRRLFKYWTTNTNLRVEFDIDRRRDNYGDDVPILKIRVFNNKYFMSLPLGSRSKGFNWFFSFLVWFSKIQVDSNSAYILLLDEPGLNLHASAQADLLGFIEDLANDYQVIYTTHSPFMVESDKLHRVRTVLETDFGTKISDSVQEKDPDTLFPLQAALGYDIAQNLFIGQNNLLVEGVSDLIYLQSMSSILQGIGRDALCADITIVPVGGLDKVATFISLLRGQELNIACLIDSFTDQKGKQRVEDMVKHKIIRDRNIRFFDEFAANDGDKADLEDMFDKSEYLNLFNQAFHEHVDITLQDLCNTEKRIVKQIEKKLGKRFNHHRPANTLAKLGTVAECFSSSTLDRFEKMFKDINRLFT